MGDGIEMELSFADVFQPITKQQYQLRLPDFHVIGGDCTSIYGIQYDRKIKAEDPSHVLIIVLGWLGYYGEELEKMLLCNFTKIERIDGEHWRFIIHALYDHRQCQFLVKLKRKVWDECIC